ncbi:hypothetical protein OPV22_030415 [Ensete ventricosum]|uniref:ubiquitinyl hydrolase 1 n=1 Tax=Ensete ventricosum TaxID=4639 RepID=A0AAV8QBZ5_ENSVE|nr:hypothetical protein OPV22_030415 [Ensete ventricosum]
MFQAEEGVKFCDLYDSSKGEGVRFPNLLGLVPIASEGCDAIGTSGGGYRSSRPGRVSRLPCLSLVRILIIMYEQDPDLVRWGLHLLLEPPSNSGYCATSSHNSTNDSRLHCADESGSSEARDSVENDEVIAHALQEQLSQIAIAEASGPSLVTEEQLQESVLTQNWLASSTTSENISGNVTLIEDLENMGASISCSTSDVKLNCGENYLLELADDSFTLDGEVCKRLNHMTSIPHVPRINKEVPSVDEEISDHQRLLERLRLYDLVDLKVQGDGNCQFRALSDQLYRSPEHHKFVRQQVVDQLISHPEIYEGYVPMSYDDYLKMMSKNGEWGDHVTLQAAADSYGVKIFILTSFKDTCYIEILPSVEKSQRVICLSFWAEVHYNSIYPPGELPVLECKNKKRWWHFSISHCILSVKQLGTARRSQTFRRLLPLSPDVASQNPFINFWHSGMVLETVGKEASAKGQGLGVQKYVCVAITSSVKNGQWLHEV